MTADVDVNAPAARLWLFGAAELHAHGGEPLHTVLAHTKHVALLAYLAREPGVLHKREKLTALFWPELDAARSRHALSKSLHHLRRALGEDTFVVRNDDTVGVRTGAVWCDAAEFDVAVADGRHRDAMSLYDRGQLLDGFHVDAGAEFDHWLETNRSATRERAVRCAMALARDAGKRLDATDAVRWARRAHELDPFDEAAFRLWLTAIARSGDRAGAMRAYQEFEALVARELDTTPSLETRDLLRSIQSTEEAYGPPGDVAEASPIQPSPAAPWSPASGDRRATTPRRRRIAGLALIGAIAGVSAAFFWRANHARDAEKRVLVVAFENRTGDTTLAQLGALAADWITVGLQETGMVRVVDPVSAMLLARSAEPRVNTANSQRAANLARRAKANVVVWGAVYRQRDSVVYRVQISDIDHEELLATLDAVSAHVSEPITAAEQLRERVAGVLAASLDRRISQVSARVSRPPTFRAYQEFLAGVERHVARDGTRAVEHLLAATRLDATFDRALVWAAFAYQFNAEARDSVVEILAGRRQRLSPLDRHALDYFLAEQHRDVPAAYLAARAAAVLSPGSEWSNNAAVLAHRFNRAADGLEHLTNIDAEHGWARHWPTYTLLLANVLHQTGRFDEVLSLVRAQRRIAQEDGRPADISLDLYEAHALAGLGRFDSAVAVIRPRMKQPTGKRSPLWGSALQTVALEIRAHGGRHGTDSLLREARAWSTDALSFFEALGATVPARVLRDDVIPWTDYHLGNIEAARAVAEQATRRDSANVEAWGLLGLTNARSGDTAGARRIMNALTNQRIKFRRGGYADTGPYLAARIAAVLGDRDSAMQLLTQMLTDGSQEFIGIKLVHDPEWASMRGYPPFDAIVRAR